MKHHTREPGQLVRILDTITIQTGQFIRAGDIGLLMIVISGSHGPGGMFKSEPVYRNRVFVGGSIFHVADNELCFIENNNDNRDAG